jgi:hypothetical protein
LDKVNHVCSRGDQLPDKYVTFTDATVSWGRDPGVCQIYLGHDNRRLLCSDIRLEYTVPGIQRISLALRSLKFALTGCERTLGPR